MKLACLLTALVTTAASGQIYLSFHNGQTTVNAMNGRPDGTVVATGNETWNNISNNGGQGLSFSGVALLDAAGNTSGATVTGVGGFSDFNNNGWGSQTQDHVMMESWYGFRAAETLTIAGLPPGYAGSYSVIIYGDSGSSRTMNYTIGSETKTIVRSSGFDGTFAEGSQMVSFSGLTGNTFTISGNPGTGDSRSAINGIAIIPGTLPEPPEINSFVTNDGYLTAGQTATLSWDTSGADTLTLSPGIGDVTGQISVTVSPSETTTYTLAASNSDGTTTQEVRVGAGPARPNIIFFLVDDMGWQDTSEPFYYDSNGAPVITPLNERYRTPAMEDLADRGIKFTNAYAMPVCTPSRVCWMTGLNSARHKVTNWTNLAGTNTKQNSTPSHNSPTNWAVGGLPEEYPTLPSLLAAAGYRTIHAGKAHFGATAYARQPENVGFDINIAGSNIGHPGSYSGDYGQNSVRPVPGLNEYHNTGTHLSEALTLEINEAIAGAVAQDMPFFAYMAHYAVHTPFETDARFSANYPTLTGSQLAYATLLEGMDKSLGDILAQLDNLGVAENTLVVFMSDNGGDAPFNNVNDSNAPLRHKKGSEYEGGSRVPFIAAWARSENGNPFQTAHPVVSNAVEDDIITIFDLYPTFLEAAGVSLTQDVDGTSILPYFAQLPGTHREQSLLLHFPHDHRGDYFSSLREGPWKYIYKYSSDTHELYNLETDLSETNNLAATNPERAARMGRTLARALKDAEAQWPVIQSTRADDPLLLPQNPAIDSDDDGLSDATEDPNRNGLVDAGETNPDSDNTDGDRTPDGAEIATGTDPLDAASDFNLTIRPTGDSFLLEWPSKAGANYHLQWSTTLTEPWNTIADNISAESTGDRTSRSVTIESDRFFRVTLKP